MVVVDVAEVRLEIAFVGSSTQTDELVIVVVNVVVVVVSLAGMGGRINTLAFDSFAVPLEGPNESRLAGFIVLVARERDAMSFPVTPGEE
jgi:hypothetical protein